MNERKCWPYTVDAMGKNVQEKFFFPDCTISEPNVTVHVERMDEASAFDIEENVDESAKEFTCVATDQTTTTKIIQTLHANNNWHTKYIELKLHIYTISNIKPTRPKYQSHPNELSMQKLFAWMALYRIGDIYIHHRSIPTLFINCFLYWSLLLFPCRLSDLSVHKQLWSQSR